MDNTSIKGRVVKIKNLETIKTKKGTDFINQDYNMIFEINNNKGNTLADFILQGKMTNKVTKVSLVLVTDD